MYINPNMIIYRHYVNWPTYNTKTAKKWLLLQQKRPTFCNRTCFKKGNFR